MHKSETIIELTRQLLESITSGDWEAYAGMCDSQLTAFEPEARGQLVCGMEFHKFYFDHLSHRRAVNTTMAQPHVRFVGKSVAIIAYTRLQQRIADGVASTSRFEETRVWELQGNKWKHVHFHRSDNGSGAG
jgi:calcium/calmodulin-dependent protein kinase (CaM kinase) II